MPIRLATSDSSQCLVLADESEGTTSTMHSVAIFWFRFVPGVVVDLISNVSFFLLFFSFLLGYEVITGDKKNSKVEYVIQKTDSYHIGY